MKMFNDINSTGFKSYEMVLHIFHVNWLYIRRHVNLGTVKSNGVFFFFFWRISFCWPETSSKSVI